MSVLEYFYLAEESNDTSVTPFRSTSMVDISARKKDDLMLVTVLSNLAAFIDSYSYSPDDMLTELLERSKSNSAAEDS